MFTSAIATGAVSGLRVLECAGELLQVSQTVCIARLVIRTHIIFLLSLLVACRRRWQQSVSWEELLEGIAWTSYCTYSSEINSHWTSMETHYIFRAAQDDWRPRL